MNVTRGWLAATLLVLTGTTAKPQSPFLPHNSLPASPQPPVVSADLLPLPGQVITTLPHETNAAPGSPTTPVVEPGATGALLPPRPSTTQAWLDYEIPACCGPVGGHGPIGTDLYFRFGTNLPFAGGRLNRTLNMGYVYFLGGRTLLFNQIGDAAWVLDLGLFYNLNNGNGSERIGFIAGSTATIRSLHRSGASLGLGHDWFSSSPGFVTGSTACTRAWGADFGIRYGTTHVDLNVEDPVITYARLQDNFGQSFIGLHTDWEFPCGGWSLLLGARFEWTYTFTNVLRSVNSDLHDALGLLTIGVRY